MKLVDPEIEYIKDEISKMVGQVSTLEIVSPVEGIKQKLHAITRSMIDCIHACNNGVIQDVN